MIKLKKANKRTQEEEKKREEDIAAGREVQEKKPKKTAAELRLQGEVQELDIPTHAKCNFNNENLMKFNLDIDLTHEVCIW